VAAADDDDIEWTREAHHCVGTLGGDTAGIVGVAAGAEQTASARRCRRCVTGDSIHASSGRSRASAPATRPNENRRDASHIHAPGCFNLRAA
jgi:hypothetical protein